MDRQRRNKIVRILKTECPSHGGTYRWCKWHILVDRLPAGVTLGKWDDAAIAAGCKSVIGYSRFCEERNYIYLEEPR